MSTFPRDFPPNFAKDCDMVSNGDLTFDSIPRMNRLNTRSFCLAAVIVLSLCCAAGAQEYEQEFKYKPDAPPKSVAVAGDFNGWSKDATPMTRGGDGVWAATVKLTEGVHLYKFVVDGDRWVNDPNADKALEVDDGHGGKNSGVLIGAAAKKFPPPEPNAIRKEALLHDPNDPHDFVRYAPGTYVVTVRAQADDVQAASARMINGVTVIKASLHKIETKYGLDRWGAVLTGRNENIGPATYSIELIDGSAKQTIRARENPAATFDTPDWAMHAVWYQIFPERFRNGDTSNDPNDHDYEHVVPWTANWWKTAPGEPPGDENFYKGQGNVWKRRYGGDVQGLSESLPYLQKLGINAIYLNPVFEADSMHKYDTSDYRHIDDNFGFKGDIAQLKGETDDPKTWQWTKSDKLFLDFVDRAHQMGFKIILDGVFNHVGKSHPFFVDVLKNGKNSKYADWFEITDWNSNPIKYIAWDTGGEPTDKGSLPVFKKDAQLGLVHGPREHIFAITKRWLAPDGDPSKGVDGWRLDVPGDIPHPFWVEWRKTVKAAKPDAYITGEIWTWAQPWLKGDEFDAVMNYRWADAAQQFFVNQQKAIKPSEFNQRCTAIAYTYPFQVALCNQNLFDSHDTDRFASMFVNPDLAYDAANRIQDNGPKYKPDKPTKEMVQRMLQAVAVQQAMVGAPMIYYGDETGMWGPDDPSNRMPMVWEGMKFEDPQVRFDPEVFAFYQRAIAMRRQVPQLQLGFFRGVVEDDDRGVHVFARELGDDVAYVVVNRSNQEQKIDVPAAGLDGKKLINWLDPEHAALRQRDGERPKLEPKPDGKFVSVTDGRFVITLKPFTTAVLTNR
jgi:glycosidase